MYLEKKAYNSCFVLLPFLEQIISKISGKLPILPLEVPILEIFKNVVLGSDSMWKKDIMG